MVVTIKVRSTQWAPWIASLLAVAALGPGAYGQFGGLRKYAEKVQKVHDATKPMTVEEEQEIGREVAAKMVAAFHVYRNDALTRYVNMVGSTVAARSERQDIQYHFAVLDSDDINAFSAPGGYVFITRGALKLCEDESELAGVLAHEVGHVAAKHVIHIVEHDKALRAGMDEASAHAPGSAYLQNMSKNILVRIFDQGLAPADEFDADSRGVRYAYAAGYPADGLERFLVRLDQATNQGANSFFTRTHPPVKDRNERIQQQIVSEHWEDANRPALADRFTTLTAMLKTKAGT
ncbi:MAG: M48 family metalloprotease [Terriglobia bacterium]